MIDCLLNGVDYCSPLIFHPGQMWFSHTRTLRLHTCPWLIAKLA